ncbi:hypothetical protein EIP86_006176 [Pleurotus ostreatoroseus]|nr:hypothetical protein EIP86_006176 [Pleurotus ostreatoroseus]
MASFYSSFFSSGLLAPHEGGAEQPTTPDPTTPRAAVRVLEDDKETTPTPADPHLKVDSDNVGLLPASSSSNNVLPSTSPDRTRPTLRRRRSSFGIAASPVTPLKNQRAAVSVRQNRARAGSVTDSVLAARTAALSVTTNATATADADINMDARAGALEMTRMGRLRSGSVGAALRPRRARTGRLPGPPAAAPLPAPDAPLPALPVGTPRRPSFIRRSHTTELSLPTLALPERRFQIDYPSPLDTPASASSAAGGREDYFGSDVVMAL